MPFREKSAWIMSAVLLLLGASYFYFVLGIWSESGNLAPPTLPGVVTYTICLVVLSVIGHIAIAVSAPREANAPVDEREQLIFSRAGRFSSLILATGIVLSLAAYLVTRNGDLLFYAVLASLLLGQIVEYASQIVFYRTAI